jgi:hypothetical protein
VEDVSDSSSEGSCDSDVPFASAMEVVGSPTAPGWSAVVRRGRRTDEELAADFWSAIGYPTPASRFGEGEVLAEKAAAGPELSPRRRLLAAGD